MAERYVRLMENQITTDFSKTFLPQVGLIFRSLLLIAVCALAMPVRGEEKEADAAKMFELRNLALGKLAPEINGEDVDEKKFRLSDYRGKVVVLDFWGDW